MDKKAVGIENESGSDATHLEQLEGLHARLQRELAAAFCRQPWPGALIDRLVRELASAEAHIAICRAAEPKAE